MLRFISLTLKGFSVIWPDGQTARASRTPWPDGGKAPLD